MRILILSQFYWPEQRSAPTNLAAVAEALHGWGHEVTVITGFPNHPFGRIYDGYRMRWRQWQQIRGPRVLRLPLYPDHSLSVLRRGWHYLSFALSAATLGAWLTRRCDPDVLLVYLPPITNLLPIRALQIIHDIPAVYWETDLWPDALSATGGELRPLVRRGLQALDSAVHRRAAKVCVNSPGLARRLEEKGVEPERLEVITDWADESLFFPEAADPDLAAAHGLANRFNVVYGGNFGPAQDLETVIEAASRLTDLEDVQLVLIGGGEEEQRLRHRVAGEKLDNVRFIARQPMNEIRRFYALADALLVHLSRDPLFESQIPSKVMAYLACAKPIVCGVAGSAAQVVRQAGAGVCATPGDPEALAAAIRRLYGMQPEERRALGASGRRTYLDRYTRDVQTRRFEAVLQEAASAASGRATEGTA